MTIKINALVVPAEAGTQEGGRHSNRALFADEALDSRQVHAGMTIEIKARRPREGGGPG